MDDDFCLTKDRQKFRKCSRFLGIENHPYYLSQPFTVELAYNVEHGLFLRLVASQGDRYSALLWRGCLLVTGRGQLIKPGLLAVVDDVGAFDLKSSKTFVVK